MNLFGYLCLHFHFLEITFLLRKEVFHYQTNWNTWQTQVDFWRQMSRQQASMEMDKKTNRPTGTTTHLIFIPSWSLFHNPVWIPHIRDKR